jgi:hypothetical protein
MTDDLKPCPFCGSAAKSDNGFLPCESVTYAWCSNQDCSLCTIEFGFTVEQWNTRAIESRASAESGKQEAVANEPVVKTCPNCNGAGSHGGRFHIDDKGSSEYEPYKCDMCDGFGTVHIETRDKQEAVDFDATWEKARVMDETPKNVARFIWDSAKAMSDKQEAVSFETWIESIPPVTWESWGRREAAHAAWLYAHPIASTDDAARWRWARETGMLGAEDESFVDAALAANRASEEGEKS